MSTTLFRKRILIPGLRIYIFQCCRAGGEEPKLSSLLEPEPKLRIAAPAPFFLPQNLRNFRDKNHESQDPR
jgi:hypothetical protein